MSMPTPRDLAARPRQQLTARPPLIDQVPTAFRARYEHVIKGSEVSFIGRLVALTVATFADYQTGLIPEDAHPGLRRLMWSTGLSEMAVRSAFAELREAGLLQRTGVGHQVHLTLTLPADDPVPR